LAPWLKRALHPDVVGAMTGRESLETAWDAQGFLEEAMANGIAAVLSSYDFSKYFDSFEHGLTKDFLLHTGVPPILANLLHDLYKNMERVMKRGKSLSEVFQGFNGFGQGDVLSLLPALLLVSFQFKVIDKLVPRVEKGAYMDDRNFRGTLEDLLEGYRIVHNFDALAGHETQAKKTAFITTCNEDKEKLKKVESCKGPSRSCQSKFK